MKICGSEETLREKPADKLLICVFFLHLEVLTLTPRSDIAV